MSHLLNFLDFVNETPKSIRGGVEMYDVKGHYKYLTLSELFEYWSVRTNCH